MATSDALQNAMLSNGDYLIRSFLCADERMYVFCLGHVVMNEMCQ